MSKQSVSKSMIVTEPPQDQPGTGEASLAPGGMGHPPLAYLAAQDAAGGYVQLRADYSHLSRFYPFLWAMVVALMTGCGSTSSRVENALPGAAKPGAVREEGRLQVGDAAPDFTLKNAKGDVSVRLSRWRGKQPVVLVFASYT